MSELSQIDPNLALTISKLNVGEISSPILTQSREGKPAYHILFVKSRTKPHRANLKDDYQRIQEEALFDKKNRIIKNWIEKKIATTHIHIGEEYKNCPFNNKWIQ
jgi:peptidyl-prolyl cis-trans isomerase SurA